ncbi:hypothetical protein [Defluviimonas salinarum]|uniref:7-cyano-7-deazaguanine synthase n=1 Tax=Defluviimonas salinarum TaxID=2992147 RepID=A0ABT3JA51_9RHOB|nr:hypothetical protein [Defluviimonas salinarum]MCW3784572.1 hypothetical protein [Defluviimonas salinarum]
MPEALVEYRGRKGLKRFPVIFEGKDRTFTISPDRIEAQLVSAMSPKLRDLLEIACAVFAADSEFSRGGPVRNNMGEAWSRDFSFTLPVRCPEVWEKPDVQRALVEAVEFLTGDNVAFRFVPKADEVRAIDFLPFETSGSAFHATEVILFSGGLDSFAGALEALTTRNGNIVLVTHRSAQKAIPRQIDLGNYLKKRFPGRVLHIQIQAIRKGHEGRETTQRSRSLLFAALGYAVAQMLGASRVSFYENGVVSQNLPISPQVIGTMATRTTHPLALVRLEKLLHAIDETQIPIRNGFEWLTKKEVVEKIAAHDAADCITRAVSCTRLRDQDLIKTHCGECSQCLDRRFAILAAGLAQHDDAIHYRTDVLRGERETDLARTMAIDWSRHAWRLADLSIEEFYQTFTSEVSRVLEGHPFLSMAEALRRTHAMQQRHSAVVRKVFQAEAAGVFDESVPDTALLKLFGSARLSLTEPVTASAPAYRSIPEAERPEPDDNEFCLDRLEVAFYSAGNRPVVEIFRLGAVPGAPASVAHALKADFEKDRDAGLEASEFRYIPPGRIALPKGATKASVHQNVSRCRQAFDDYYLALFGEHLPDNFLIQSKVLAGYRLDPEIRIVGRHQVGPTELLVNRERGETGPSAIPSGLSAPGA